LDSGPTPDEVMFSAAVRAEQTSQGSRESHARRAAAGRFPRELSVDAAAFIATRNSAYFATASADGQPYVQHRGGENGFLKVFDRSTLAFADYEGNKQYITLGNLGENQRSFLFLMDYENARRLKLWGTSRLSSESEILARLRPPPNSASIVRAIVFTVLAWDWNCSQHIPRLAPIRPQS
jgi:predicted pyridoxine 5'-phosphate oxidase superfamily flavin-nucleotide-binding protein